MSDYLEGIKKEIAEIKFLIHDLRVEGFINEAIHFHTTLNTDLEIYGISQLQVLHTEDLQQLKRKAFRLRKAFRNYYNSVRSYSPDQTVLLNGTAYVDAILDICRLILDPRWGRIDGVLTFLPDDCRTVRSRSHYRNCVRWIEGVATRIERFMAEQEKRDVYEQFDIAADIRDFTRNRLYGYVTETSSARVELLLDRLDPVVIGGNRYRFRRMLFNLIMNSVDAMAHKKLGVLNISCVVEGNRVLLQVNDNGTGMTPEKINQLLRDKKTLDGEVHSLGFVFVRQTVTEFNGELSIQSELDKGTTVTISLPYLPGATPSPPKDTQTQKLDRLRSLDEPQEDQTGALATPARSTEEVPSPSDAYAIERDRSCGKIIYLEYRNCEADFPGSIFALGINDENEVDFFVHQPYERLWNITHEDLSPMFFQATIRGRLEEDEEKKPALILKAPHDSTEYFEFRSIPETMRNRGNFVAMVHDEYVRIARKLLATGLPEDIDVYLAGLQKFFPSSEELLRSEPFPLELLAKQPLSTESQRNP
jgi:hypothetical protein